ncbi:3-hydroxyisobutyrate dehydrogenase [Nakamurella sp. YIM 132084]|uniref:3-hydroxyisobutyrate dehydrogenase n=2 Tax=Nakamurella leprariae TaxID=2803911 RepID=A0A938Y8Y0_9ACTN|nr:3-hydroxyisobutyrate dehydrogenase [Nakamurella leprariae]
MKVAWIGLGNMGGPMAGNLVAAGYTVTGYDPSEQAQRSAAEHGVSVATVLAEAVAGADVVFTMLPNGRLVSSVLLDADGVLDHLPAGALVVDSSTIDIATARELHEAVTGRGFRFLDAPVSGGVFGAAAGTLTFMVGGTGENLEAARPLIEVLAGRVFHAGGPGAGQSAKLANNMMLAINTAGLAEGATLADRLGLDPAVFYQIAEVSSGSSWALKNWYPSPGVVETAAVNHDFNGGFAVSLMRKDVGLALEAGAGAGLDLPYASRALADLDRLIEAGWSGKDTASMVKLVDGTLPDPGSTADATAD